MRVFPRVLIAIAIGFTTVCLLHGQDPVVATNNTDALFKSSDPALQANKMVVYGIFRDLLEAGHWELADRYLTDRYIQHNPNAASGRAGVVAFFTQVLKIKPKPISRELKSQIVAVIAENDLVTVLSVSHLKDKNGAPYTTTWFDTWRIKDGKADEHWDSAVKQ